MAAGERAERLSGRFPGAATFRRCSIQGSPSSFGMRDKRSCEGRNDLMIEPIGQRLVPCGGDDIGQGIAQMTQSVHQCFLVHTAGGCEGLPFAESDERNIVLTADFHRDALFNQLRIDQLTGQIVQRT